MKNIRYFLIASLLVGFSSVAQAQLPIPENGVQDTRPNAYAFTNATVYVDYQTSLTNATIIVRNGRVEAAGQGITVPDGLKAIDLKGKFIYPSFIDLVSEYGMPAVKRSEQHSFAPQFDSNKEGAYYWNEAIRAEANAAEQFNPNSQAADELRRLGFGAVLTQQANGIARGTSALVNLADQKPQQTLLRAKAATGYSFSKGTSNQEYPSSLMGSIALLRQTFLDAQYYKQNPNVERNLSLEALNQNAPLPAIFEAGDKYNVLRADRVGDEFGLQFIIKGKGNEYQRLEEIKATQATLILPLTFPDAYNVENPFDAQAVGLAEMLHWENAPKNPALLAQKQVPFCLTAAGLKDKKAFLTQLRKAVSSGLSEADALKALTLTPANILKYNELGNLRKGSLANFFIASGNIFAEESSILENVVQGERYTFSDIEAPDMRGIYELTLGQMPTLKLEVSGKIEQPNFKITQPSDTTPVRVKASIKQKDITLSFDLTPKDSSGDIRLSGWYAASAFKGDGQLPDGTWVKWQARYKEAAPTKAPQAKPEEKKEPLISTYFLPYVQKDLSNNVLITNANVWTNEADGKLENTDVLVENGKISKIGKGLSAGSSVRVINAQGKHLTAGIIDEHSHIAISGGVNEGSNAVTAEVRIGDVLDGDDMDIYRQLAGGVVASQLLHGSANPVGGQSALIKLRWGSAPEQLKIEGADGFIKFALGENVKQSNWGDFNTVRFPQTRMGVEQVYLDAFGRAKEYNATWQKFVQAKNKKAPAPYRSLQLETLAEILNSKRFITCHSYVQSEINMLMHMADSMGFKVNTFTHILEGYKVADKMKKHNVGGSTFADWWAYKMEVKDAIPYNAAIMHKVGITTAINSDDAEMARRLNQEAGKTMKYGGVSEEDALKMVTLNPAKLLHLDKRMGSIAVGKDADLVIWNNSPVSIYARPEQTFVEGKCLFDQEKDKEGRALIAKERQRLIQKMLKAKQQGGATQAPNASPKHRWHCEDLDHYED